MPTGTYPKSPRSISVPPSNNSQWTPRTRSIRRSRALAIVAVLLLFLLWYNHGPREPVATTRIMRNGLDDDGVDWSRFAYTQYATNSAYLCNSVMIFDALKRLGSRADRVLYYPAEWDTIIHDKVDRDSQLLVKARDWLDVKLVPVNMQSVKRQAEEDDEETWDFSINKFLAWNQTEYDRVLHLDSDITLFKHLDDLFFLPAADVAMPRAYWELPHTRKLTSLLVLLKPSVQEYEALIHAAFTSEGTVKKFDMELLNDRYRDSAMVLPHRTFALLSGEFRAKDHSAYLGNDYEIWDTDDMLRELRLVHFSDWPLPKPWIMWPQALLKDMLPKCRNNPGTPRESGCDDREVWRELYDDFRGRRRDICGYLSIPAPTWPPPPKMSKPKPKAGEEKKAQAKED